MILLDLLVVLIVIGLFWWASTAILAAFSIGNPIAGLVQVLIVCIAVLWVMQIFGLLNSGFPALRVR